MNPSSLSELLAHRDRAKTSGETSLQSSELGPATPIATCMELDRALHQAEVQCPTQHANIVSLYARGHQVGIGLGLPESFVSVQCYEPAPGPCFITISDPPAEKDAVFYFLGGRRAEVPRRNLLPASKARAVLREFFKTGERSTSVSWQEL